VPWVGSGRRETLEVGGREAEGRSMVAAGGSP
jgi:hypothetical protein